MKTLFLLFTLACLLLLGTAWRLADTNVNSQLGPLYTASSWNNTSDFIPAGNATAVLNGSYVTISSATQDNWNNLVYITNYFTKLEKWNFKLRFRIAAWSGSSYGLGFGLKSTNPNVQNDVMGFLQTTNTGTGNLYIVKSGRTTLQAGVTPLGVHLNDIIEVEGIFYDSVFTFNAHNISSGSTASTSFTFASNGSTQVVPNTGHFALMELGGTHEVQGITISSEEVSGASVVAVGDSKTIGYFSNTFAGRYAAQLRNNFPPVVISAGGADRITEVLSRQQELINLSGQKYLLSIGSNDLRYGASLSQTQLYYDSLVRILQATGAQVYHIVLPEDYTKPLGVNLLAFKNWVATTYAAFYINVWDSMATGNLLKGIYDTGDGVHLNQAGNNKIYEAIIASNKLGNGITLPLHLLSFTAHRQKNGKVLLGWQATENGQPSAFTIEKSTDGIHFRDIHNQLSNPSGTYQFMDLTPGIGPAFYRLKWNEADGAIQYSFIITVSKEINSLFASPIRYEAGGAVRVSLQVPAAQVIPWRIISLTGQVMKRGSFGALPGANEWTLPVDQLPHGLYLLDISNRVQGLHSYRFVK